MHLDRDSRDYGRDYDPYPPLTPVAPAPSPHLSPRRLYEPTTPEDDMILRQIRRANERLQESQHFIEDGMRKYEQKKLDETLRDRTYEEPRTWRVPLSLTLVAVLLNAFETTESRSAGRPWLGQRLFKHSKGRLAFKHKTTTVGADWQSSQKAEDKQDG